MPGWLLLPRAWCIAHPSKPLRRFLSTRSIHSSVHSSAHSSIQHIQVPCASSGAITVSLHNISQHPDTAPLAVFIPPFSHTGPDPAPLPPCLQDHPTAIINYRWQPHEEDGDEPPLYWPTPIHDVLFGYTWLQANLGVTRTGKDNARPRSAYVYGSYLGASLAAGLALTESYIPDPTRTMTIRGLIAHNGIYNWTMFLPDHPIHKPKVKPSSKGRRGGLLTLPTFNDTPTEEEGIFTELKHQTPGLFSTPGNLFDPFASACLFFHTPNLHVPDDFTTPLSASPSLLPSEWTEAIDSLSSSSTSSPDPSTTATPTTNNTNNTSSEEEEDTETADSLLARAAALAKQARPPRKSYMVFPPRHSTLRLPETLLLYDAPESFSFSPTTTTTSQQRWKQRKWGVSSSNNFEVQARELAGVMRRSLGIVEFKQRAGGGEEEFEDVGVRGREAERRVQLGEVDSGVEEQKGGYGLREDGEEMVREWLRDRIDEEV